MKTLGPRDIWRGFVHSHRDYARRVPPIVWYGGIRYLWFLPARLIREYNWQDCEHYYPDWQNGRGTKVRPFLGYVFIINEGEAMTLAWWKYLERV